MYPNIVTFLFAVDLALWHGGHLGPIDQIGSAPCISGPDINRYDNLDFKVDNNKEVQILHFILIFVLDLRCSNC